MPRLKRLLGAASSLPMALGAYIGASIGDWRTVMLFVGGVVLGALYQWQSTSRRHVQ